MRKALIPAAWILNNAANEKTTAISTLTSTPNEIILSENVANFTFSPVLTTIGHNLAQGLIQVGAHVPVGSTITILSTYTSVTLTASATPGANEFYTETVAPTGAALIPYLETVAESIADTLNQSLSLYGSYSITLLGTSMSIAANRYGSAYNFTTFTSSTTSINSFAQVGTSKFLSQDKIGYACFANVFVGDEVYGAVVDKSKATFVSTKLIDSNSLDANMRAASVGNYINHVLPLKSLTPSDGYYKLDTGVTSTGSVIPSEDGFGNVNLILRPYFIEYGDKFSYVENQSKKAYTRGVSEVKWMQLGAFDSLLPYDMQDYVWNPTLPTTFSWLTSCPNGKTVTDNSHEYLQVITKSTTNSRNFNLEIVFDFYDGTTFALSKTARSYANIGGNVSFDVSPNAMDIQGIEATQGKLVDKYKIRLTWDVNGSVVGNSKFKEYKYDRNCYTRSNNIIFVNEFGAWDSMEFKGEASESLERSVDTIVRSLPSNANTSDSISTEVSINIGTDVDSIHSIHSGLLTTSILGWSRKLMESSAVYIWDEVYSKYRSILILESDYDTDSVQTGESIEVSYKYGTSNNSLKR